MLKNFRKGEMLAKKHMGSYFARQVNEDHAKKSKLVAIKISVPFSINISCPCGIWSKIKAVFYMPRLENWIFVGYFTTFFPFVSARVFMLLVIFLQLFSS